jgi:hypothetical protein
MRAHDGSSAWRRGRQGEELVGQCDQWLFSYSQDTKRTGQILFFVLFLAYRR